MTRLRRLFVVVTLAGALGEGSARAGDLPAFDFTQPSAAVEWLPTHDVEAVVGCPEGLAITVAGEDPFVTGPPQDFPVDKG